MSDQSVVPDFIAVMGGNDRLPPLHRHTTVTCGPATVAYRGFDRFGVNPLSLGLSPVVRTTDRAVPPSEITDQLRQNPAALAHLLPPFAAAAGSDQGVTVVVDSMGFRQLFHSAPNTNGPAALATSALVLGSAIAPKLDDTALAVQSLLGWQLGQRTLFTGVVKLAPGVVARLTEAGLELTPPPTEDESPLRLMDAVRTGAKLLRQSLEALLDENSEAVIQLTGGQDSRLLLSAVPQSRRSGLRAMTLGVSGGDVAVATDLARRYGLRHEVHGMASLEDLTPVEAWRLARTSAINLGAMSDPLAHAALTVAESSFEQGTRISGLGGEVARGFYYLGRVHERPVTRAEATQLATWRMFVNEAIETGLLTDEFSAWSRDAAFNEVFVALAATGRDWDRATDDLYLRHRMQRWAGLTDTAVAHRRTVINPMLDNDFLSIARRLRPADKANSLFLAKLQMELDPELGRIPLEGRPAPIAYAEPGLRHSARQKVTTGKRLVHKAFQRLQGANRPPAGGAVLAAKVVAHWRSQPEILSSLPQSSIVNNAWLDKVLDQTIQPRPSSVAFLTNLVVALAATQSRPPSKQQTPAPSVA